MNNNCCEDKKCSVVALVLSIIGAVVVIAGIAYAVYRYCTPDYLDEFEDDDDDFLDDLDEDEDDDFDADEIKLDAE